MQSHSSDPSDHSKNSDSSKEMASSPMVAPPQESFLSIDSFLDSVSTGALLGTPDVHTRNLRPVDPLDLLEEDADLPAPEQFAFQPEPEPELEPDSGIGVGLGREIPKPVPPPRPQTQSREAALVKARSPVGSAVSSLEGSDDSGDRPEPGGAVFDVVHQGENMGLSVGAMGIQLFRDKTIIVSQYVAYLRHLYDDMIGGWSFDVGDGPLSPSNKRAVGVVRICFEHFSSEQVKEMQSSGAWMDGTPTLKVFGVMSQRVGKYITMQMDARFGKMIRDREAAQAEEQPLQVGDDVDGLGFDEDPSLEYVAYEQHRCGLLGRFLQDSQAVAEVQPVPLADDSQSRIEGVEMTV